MPSPSKKYSRTPPPTSKLRIVGGQWRGRTLPFPAVQGLRPTGSRIRETLFNWLQPTLAGSRCLDLFAGSGALGFEALSRGADVSVMIEQDPQVARQLQSNASTLRAGESAQIINTNALLYLQGQEPEPFDLIFLDPPFTEDLWQNCIELLETGNWLAPNALLYVELPRASILSMSPSWQCYRQKTTSQVTYGLHIKQTNPASAR